MQNLQHTATPTTSSSAMRVTVKLSLADETHRVTLDGDHALSFEALLALVATTFGAATPKTFALVYTDNEGDLVTVSSTAEVDEARSVLLSHSDSNGSSAQMRPLHFRVVPRVSAKDQLPSAVLSAVDELSSTIARLASDTRESLAQSAYLERSRATVVSSAKHTRAFFDAARRELAQRLRVVHARIAGELERRRSSASDATVELRSVDEPSSADREAVVDPQRTQHTLYDASDSSAEDASEHEDDSDDEASPAVRATAAAALADEREDADGDDVPVLAAPAVLRGTDAAYASDAETAASSDSDSGDGDDDDGWDIVPDVWSADVALIRTIVPHVHVDDCVATLRKYSGDLEAAINELTEA